MAKIQIYPAKILKQVAPEMESVDKTTLEQIEQLRKTLFEGENAAGLAAPQIGVGKRFFGIKDSKKQVKVYINPKLLRVAGESIFPKLISEEKEENFLEGCLSFPDYFGTVKRFLKIEISWQEADKGKLDERKGILEGFEAIVFQHELDHLNGILLIDRVRESKGKLFKVTDKKMVPVSVEKFKL